MKYQLVIQTRDSSLDAVIALEDMITDLLNGTSEIDGHDFGSGEANIFIITTKPESDCNAIKTALGQRLEKEKIKIAYRALGSSEYISLYPKETENFKIK